MSSTPPLSPRLSLAGASQLGGLLAGLDRLDPILDLPEHPRSADPPHAFGRYQLRARLGAGAHGVVLLADDPRLDRQVVVKVPQPVVLSDPELRERFVREARAAAGLEQPGIVPVFEAGEIDGLPYLVAGYVPGPSLAKWLDTHPGPVPPRDAARLLAAIAAAVHHAHERGVLHCDLTPSNVLLTPVDPAPEALPSYRPTVTDFGLARLIEEDPALTRTFRIAGTPLYMAPEQARGERRNLTARTDIYALGAILYHLLTGQPAHVGASTPDALQRIVAENVPAPQVVSRDVPRDLAAVCLKCLEQDPTRRYTDADALAADLGRFLAGSPTLARPVRWPARTAMWIRRNPALAALTALVATTLVLLAGREWVYRNELAANNVDLQNAVTREQAAATDADRQRELAIDQYRLLRRRTYLAEIRNAAALVDRGLLTDRSVGAWEPEYGDDLRGFEWAYLTRLGRGTRTWTRQRAPVHVSPITDDGRCCATVAGRELRIWEVGTGRDVAAWTHTARLDQVVAVSADGGYAATATVGPRDGLLLFTRGSPHPRLIKGDTGTIDFGRIVQFAGAAQVLAASTNTVSLHDAATGALVRTFVDDRHTVMDFGTDPRGRTVAIVFWTGSAGYVVLYEVASGRELGRSPPCTAERLAISADGRHVLVSCGGELQVWDLGGGALRAGFRLPPNREVKAVERLADGRMVAASWLGGTSGDRTIAVAIWNPRTDSWTMSQVLSPCLVQSVRFRPDGLGLVVGGLDSTLHEMDLVRPAPEVGWPVAGTAEAWAVAVSPDGRTIATGGDDYAVRVWDAKTGTRLAERTDHGSLVTSAVFAPDGRWFATGGFDGRVVIRDSGTAAPRRVLSHGPKVRALAVSPNGELIAASGATGRVSVWEAATGRLLHGIEGTASVIHTLLFDSSGSALIVPLEETELTWIEVSSGRRIRTVPLPLRPSCMARSPVGGGLAVGFETGDIVALDAFGGREESWEVGSHSRLNALAFSPDGRTVAAAADNGSVLLRQGNTGDIFLALSRDGPRVHGMAFAPDGSFLAGARHDGRLVLWPAEGVVSPRR